MTEPRPDITRIVLVVLSILTLMLASFWILRPFLGAMIWATTIVVATWPVLLAVQRFFRGRRWPAVAVLSLVLLGLLFVPFLLSVSALVRNSDAIVTRVQELSTLQLPPAPGWVAGLPLVGAQVASAWEGFVGEGLQPLMTKSAPYASDATKWLIGRIGNVGLALIQFLLTVVIAAILWSSGEQAVAMARRFARRLGGKRGESTLDLAGAAIRGVAMGVVVTALLQSVLCGLGLWIAGVPFPAVLTVVAFVLCIAQIGPLPLLLLAVAYVFWTGSTGWGVFLLVWTIVVGPLDNFLRPILIKKGVDMPLIMVFAGVIGGLMTLGLIGIFVGPVVLAVTHALAESWATSDLSES